MATVRGAPATSLPRWARPGEGRWDDWLTAEELAAAGELASVVLLYRLIAGLDVFRENGGPDWEAARVEPTYPRMPHEIDAGERHTGAPPKWLRDAARRRAGIGGMIHG